MEHPSFAEVADDPTRARVLLLGDSISMGYTLEVRELLSGIANVHRPADNCADTGHGLKNLDAWLSDHTWDAIHFNFGLHDLKYLDATGKYVSPDIGQQVTSLEQYETNLRQIVARLQQTRAKLVWCTTTPVPSGALARIQGDEMNYNRAAAKVAAETGIAVDDLWAVAMKNLETLQRPRDVHFTPEGYHQLAQTVAPSIRSVLPNRSFWHSET